MYGARQQLFRIIPRSVIYLKLGRKIELHGGDPELGRDPSLTADVRAQAVTGSLRGYPACCGMRPAIVDFWLARRLLEYSL